MSSQRCFLKTNKKLNDVFIKPVTIDAFELTAPLTARKLLGSDINAAIQRAN